MTPDASDDRAPADSLDAPCWDSLSDAAGEAEPKARWPLVRRLCGSRSAGWLTSLCLHLAALLVLALVSWGAKPLPGLRALLALRQDESESELSSVELLDPLQVAAQAPPDPAHASWHESESPSASLETAMISAVDPLGDLASGFDGLMPSPQHLDAEISSNRTRTGAGAQFYGIEAEGNTFVFIVDRSNSMRGEKLQEAKKELMYAVRRLSAEQKFYVIFFAGWSEFMRFEPQGPPEPAPVNATTENIDKLAAWVDWIQVEPWTNPFDAVKFAMQIAPDAVYLLTDGEFTDNGRTMRFLKSHPSTKVAGERDTSVAIHCVGFYDRAGEPALKRIAQQFGGSYKFVPPPKFAVRP